MTDTQRILILLALWAPAVAWMQGADASVGPRSVEKPVEGSNVHVPEG